MMMMTSYQILPWATSVCCLVIKTMILFYLFYVSAQLCMLTDAIACCV